MLTKAGNYSEVVSTASRFTHLKIPWQLHVLNVTAGDERNLFQNLSEDEIIDLYGDTDHEDNQDRSRSSSELSHSLHDRSSQSESDHTNEDGHDDQVNLTSNGHRSARSRSPMRNNEPSTSVIKMSNRRGRP